MKKIIILAALMISVATYGQQQQQERIIRFHSDILIESDGRIEVAEHIRVYAAGKEIKRGIVRDLPLSRKNNKGKRVRMDYNVLAVKRDGENTKYDIEHEDGNLSIYIRDVNVFLKPGEYDYTIVYESYGHVGFFDDFDELYWNVTGNDWIFPIEKASAAITLPGNANAGNTACYTGVQGSTGKNCSVEDRGNVQVFTANRRLAPREGLTVSVAFPRNIISRPPPPSKVEAFFSENSHSISGWTGALICLLYFFFTIRTAGERPEKPVAIPTFKPPRNLSPASVHYLTNKRYESKTFTATLVEMAVKGAMNIRCAKKKYSLVNKMNTERLRSEEKQIHAAIFAGSETVEVKQVNYDKFLKANTALNKAMEKQWQLKDYFRDNGGVIALGGLILNGVFALYIILTGGTEEVALALAMAAPFIALEIAFLFSALQAIKFGCSHLFSGVMIAFFAVGSVLVVILEDGSSAKIHWPSAGFFAVMSLLYVWYTKRIRVFTAEGAKLTSELEGFKMYLKTAEEHRLNMLTPPERTPELFEKLLPYALALGVNNEWCKKFDDVLKKFDYRPEWYDSPEKLSTMGFATSFAALGTSFNSSVSSARTDPSSGSSSWSSGSGGGGSSGGGGGGGGGRGC